MFFAIALRSAIPKQALPLLLIFGLLVAPMHPASAATAGQISTRNIILAATAVTLGIVLYENSQHKAVTHTTVVGHTSDGGVVYGDGRILYPGGVVVYASNDGIHMCAFYGAGERCGPHAVGHPWRYEDEDQWHGEGLHKGWYKHHGNQHDEGGEHEGDHRGHLS